MGSLEGGGRGAERDGFVFFDTFLQLENLTFFFTILSPNVSDEIVLTQFLPLPRSRVLYILANVNDDFLKNTPSPPPGL